MNRGMSGGVLMAVGALAVLAGTVQAVDTPEVEPNDSKATATVANNGGIGLDSGDTISGVTTGTSTTVPGAASVDTFIVTTKARPLGIYKHTMTLTTSGTAGHVFSIRGLNQSAGVPGTTDTTVQTGSTAYPGAPTGARVIQWYGFGKQERIYVRVTGSATTTAPYSAVLQTTSVDPIVMSGTMQQGDIQIKPNAATASALDTDWWMFDSTLSAIPGFGHDDADEVGCIRTMSNGTYTIAMNRYNVATNQGSPTDDTFRSGPVLDFPDAIACSNTLTTGSATMLAVETASGYEISGSGSTDTPFGIMFFRFEILEPTQPTDPVGTGSLGGAVQNCGDQNALVRVAVRNGQVPPSTGVTVVADASGLGGSSTLSLNDAGVDGDAVAGDNVFSARVVVSYTVDAGVPIPVAFTVADAQGRSSQGSFNATVNACTLIGACCLPDGCQQISRFACEASGGSYVGNGIVCDVPPGYAVTGQGAAFEDISFVGTLLTQGDDTTAFAPIGFDFSFYGNTYSSVNVCSNGFLTFSATSTAYVNGAIPSASVPNDAVYAIWDDFNFTGRGQCYHATLGTSGIDQRFIVQWTDVPQYGGTDSNTFQAVLFQDGTIELRYGLISVFTDADATVGVENIDGTVALSIPGSIILSNTSLRLENTSGGPSCTGCAPCAADYNQDGGVDGGDIAAFFPDWEASASCADVNLDGGIDGGDIESFFSLWQEGGC